MTETTKQITTKPRRSAWTILLTLAGVGILLLSAITVKQWVDNKPKRQQRPPVIELPYVETIPAALSDNVVNVRAGGFVSAKTTANITPQVSGKILRLSPNLVTGQTVAKGEVLAQLGTTDYRVALTNAQSTLKNAEAGVLSAQASLSGAKASLASAKASHASADATLSSAKSSYEQAEGQSRQAARDVKSLGVKATRLNLKKPQLAAAKAAIDNATASIESAKAAELSAKAQVDSGLAAVESAKAQVESAKAQVELAQTNLNRTTITAPFNAIVLSSDAAVGEIANNSTLLASLAATDVYTVKLTLDSKAMKLVSLGDLVTLTDSVYGNTYQAKLSRIAPGLDEKNRTLAAYVDIAEPTSGEQPLLLQNYLTAVIDGDVVANSVKIPNSAIVNNAYVWAKQADDSIVTVAIDVIYRYGDKTLVTFASPVTDLITRPKDSFVEGQKVTTSRATTQPREKSRGKGKGAGKENSDKADEQASSSNDSAKKPASE